MKPLDVVEMVGLAAMWGASFLFMRIAAPEFGPVALTALRLFGAVLFLLPLLVWGKAFGAMRTHWRAIAVVGLFNSALPFTLFAVAALAINAGLSAILNATPPLWTAVIGALWLGDRLTASRLLGLCVGFAGVVFLAWDKASFSAGDHGVSAAVAIAACLVATLCYGFAANYTKRVLHGVIPIAVVTGSQLAAGLVLALPAVATWPTRMPSAGAWWALGGLAVLVSALGHLMYFRLIARVGPARAISVTFLLPAFGVLWGAVFLGEAVSAEMLVGCAVILVGTALATGIMSLPAAIARDRR
jgi:drug/metabolite transporter (DMT)-like permease